VGSARRGPAPGAAPAQHALRRRAACGGPRAWRRAFFGGGASLTTCLSLGGGSSVLSAGPWLVCSLGKVRGLCARGACRLARALGCRMAAAAAVAAPAAGRRRCAPAARLMAVFWPRGPCRCCTCLFPGCGPARALDPIASLPACCCAGRRRPHALRAAVARLWAGSGPDVPPPPPPCCAGGHPPLLHPRGPPVPPCVPAMHAPGLGLRCPPCFTGGPAPRVAVVRPRGSCFACPWSDRLSSGGPPAPRRPPQSRSALCPHPPRLHASPPPLSCVLSCRPFLPL
jgi:hypothetical protein